MDLLTIKKFLYLWRVFSIIKSDEYFFSENKFFENELTKGSSDQVFKANILPLIL